MIRTQSFLLPSLALAFAGGAFAQGDDCSTAAALVGTGTFSYDTTGLTTSGYLGGACGGFNLNYDGFFQWTAPAAGDYSFDTFGTSYDTTLQVAAGVGCAATCIAFNDDSGGFLQSNVAAFGLLAGDSILIQVAGYSATTGFGPGSLTITALASAGPTDTCGTAGTLTGVGTFSYDTTANTTSLFNGGGGCGAVNLNVDAFFQWTAPANGDYNIDTVGTSYDTKLAVHSGVACGATCLDYNDDTFGLQSQVSIVGATAGDQFLIQVGGYNATHFGPGTLNITTYVDPCSGASDDSFEENDDCATAAPVGDGTYPGLFINTADGKDTFSTCVLDGATITVDILFTDSLMDLDLFLWDAGDANCGTGYGTTDLANGFSTTDNETVTYTNLTGATQNITIEVDVYLAGTQDCNMYDLVVSGSGGCAGGSVGTPFCDPMNPNSTGASTHLAGTFGTGVGSDLH
ncbi:MAG TPA: hypothetical protein PLJ12_05690, partial [Planctomycetota bacterium]|nr:hypothetical protein [Planctomycetota bacterium]